MGLLIAKFRKKKTTEQVLEQLDKEIKAIEAYRRNTEQAQQKIVGRFLLVSVGIYLVTAFLFYFYFFPASFYERLFYIIPLILAPVIIICTKKGLTWYYKRIISKNQFKFKKLNEEKRKLLENVMENETYKVAKSILEKYAPEQIRKNNYAVPSMDMTPVKQNSSAMVPSTAGVRQRLLPPPTKPSRSSFGGLQTPVRPSVPMAPATVARMSVVPIGSPASIQNVVVPGTPLPLPRSILPRDRSVFDKMVEYLVGDGPSNRYALICKQCSSHNGMALKEEFEYLSFRCCYCYTFNPARKKRPAAPKLENELKSPLTLRSTLDTSESEINSASETDSDLDNEKTKQLKTLYASAKETNSDIEVIDKSDVEVAPSTEETSMDVDETVAEESENQTEEINDELSANPFETENDDHEVKSKETSMDVDQTVDEKSENQTEEINDELSTNLFEAENDDHEAKSKDLETQHGDIESKKDLYEFN